MRYLTACALVIVLTKSAFAAPTCTQQAADKKLAGAALTSFMGKCTKDVTATCQAAAKAKKLSGAAFDSNVKKCVADAVGS
jgi:hypothetical protein